MSDVRRVAVMFDPARAGFHVRGFLLGIHAWAAANPGRWQIVHDPHARRHLGDFDGLLGPGSRVVLAEAKAAGVAYVAVGCSGHVFDIPRVRENAYMGGRLAANHLLERRCGNFAFLRLLGGYASSIMEHGFRNALARCGQVANYMLIPSCSHPTWRRWRGRTAALRAWLGELPKPVGVVATSDALARSLVEQCEAQGFGVPDDVAVVGAGNDPALCLGPPPPLTSLDFDCESVGRRAAALLDSLLRGQRRPKGNILVPPTLVPRASTGSGAPTADAKVAEALAYIADHAHEPLLVAHVAEAVGLSERTLRRRFAETRSRPMVEEIALARLRNAADLLQFTRLSAAAVARLAGFRTVGHFRSLFRRHYGLTPTQWRRGRPTPPPRTRADLDHAKRLLAETRLPIETIAYACDFKNPHEMRRAFRAHLGVRPSDYRRKARAERLWQPSVEVELIGPEAEQEKR